MAIGLIIEILIIFGIIYGVSKIIKSYSGNIPVPGNLAGQTSEEFTVAAVEAAKKTKANLKQMHDRLGVYIQDLQRELEGCTVMLGVKPESEGLKIAARINTIKERLSAAQEWQRRALMLTDALEGLPEEALSNLEIQRRNEALDSLANDFESSTFAVETEAASTISRLKTLS